MEIINPIRRNSSSKGTYSFIPNHPSVTMLATAFVYLVYLGYLLNTRNFDVTWFVLAGDKFSDKNLAFENLKIYPDSQGYDGQFYYRLALDPFTDKLEDFGVVFDVPQYRQQRILYPLIVWSMSLGNPYLIPYMLILVNFISLCVIGWCGGYFFKLRNYHSVLGILFPLYYGFFISFALDLVEILEVALLMVAILTLHRNQFFFIFFILLAMLAKETALILVVTMIIYQFFRRSNRWPILILPILAYLIWRIWLYQNWSSDNFDAVRYSIGFPLSGFLSFVISIIQGEKGGTQLVWMFQILSIVVFFLLVILKIRHSDAFGFIKLGWIIYAFLAFSLTRAVWVEDWAFMRALSEFYVLGIMILFGFQYEDKSYKIYNLNN